jgi:hypothetical protein
VLAAFLSVLGGFLAGSGGFWVFLKRRFEREDATRKLIMGLAHDKIIYLGLKYLEKGWVNKDEYEDLFKYFWEPYKTMGGDGSAERIVKLVQTLPFRPERRQFPEIREVTEALDAGAHKVIEKIEQGDDKFERPRDEF